MKTPKKKKTFLNQKGFTLVEIILTMVVLGITFGSTAVVLLNNVQSFSFIRNQQSVLSDVRYAMNRMNQELLRVGDGEITAMTNSSISFIDDNGAATSFSSQVTNGQLALMRGNAILAQPISSFTVTGYDGSGVETAVPANVRRIQVVVQGDPGAGNGTGIVLTTTVIPRDFIYAGYQ